MVWVRTMRCVLHSKSSSAASCTINTPKRMYLGRYRERQTWMHAYRVKESHVRSSNNVVASTAQTMSRCGRTGRPPCISRQQTRPARKQAAPTRQNATTMQGAPPCSRGHGGGASSHALPDDAIPLTRNDRADEHEVLALSS